MNLKALRAGCASRGAEVSCKEHVKIKIFISKKEILSIQNDGYLMDKMAKNVIMNKDCTLWRNDVSEKK